MSFDDESALLHFIEAGAVSPAPTSGSRARRPPSVDRSASEFRDDSEAASFGYGYEEEERQRRLYAQTRAATEADPDEGDDEELEDDEAFDEELEADEDDDEAGALAEAADEEAGDEAEEDDEPRPKRARKSAAITALEARIDGLQKQLAGATTELVQLKQGQQTKQTDEAHQAGLQEFQRLQQRWQEMDPLEAEREKSAYLANMVKGLVEYRREVEQREQTAQQLRSAADQHEQVVQFLAQGGRSDENGVLNHSAAEALLPEDIEELRDFVEWDAWTMQAWCDRRLQLRKQQKVQSRKRAGAQRRADTQGAERGAGGRGGAGKRPPQQPSRTLEELLSRL